MMLNEQAAELNKSIEAANPHVYGMLSRRGRAIYFPKKGILAQAADAKGRTINATIGTAFEDSGASMCLDSLFRRVNLDEKHVFAYAPSPGRPEIRTKWKEMLVAKNPSLAGKAVSQPVVTSALTHGLSMAGYLFVDEGDTIVMPDLFWENYELVFNLAYGSSFSLFPMFVGNAGFNVEGLKSALAQGAPGKRIVLLNFPNNPTGYTVTVEEGLRIRDVLVEAANAGNDLVVLVDDAYFGLVFENGIMTESMFTLLANAHERILAVKFDGPTKEDYVWGFRVGFVTFGTARNSPALYSALEGKLAGAIRGSISNSSNLGQSLLLAAYEDPNYEHEKIEKFAILKKRYGRIRQILAEHPEYAEEFTALPYNSGYFMCVRYRGGDAEALRQVLLSKFSVGVIAQADLLRVAFSSVPYAMMDRLFSSIYQAGKELRAAGRS